MQICCDLGLHYQTVRAVLRRYQFHGVAFITPGVRGRKADTQRLLNVDQESHIKRIVCEKRPEQLKMEFALCNRAAVRQLIAQEFDIELGGGRTVGDYLVRWGFTAKRRIKRAYEQRPAAVKAWFDEQYWS